MSILCCCVCRRVSTPGGRNEISSVGEHLLFTIFVLASYSRITPGATGRLSEGMEFAAHFVLTSLNHHRTGREDSFPKSPLSLRWVSAESPYFFVLDPTHESSTSSQSTNLNKHSKLSSTTAITETGMPKSQRWIQYSLTSSSIPESIASLSDASSETAPNQLVHSAQLCTPK